MITYLNDAIKKTHDKKTTSQGHVKFIFQDDYKEVADKALYRSKNNGKNQTQVELQDGV